jgi:hypothetical protein
MSDPLGRWFPALDPVTGMFTLPLWTAGAFAALLVAFCILAFNRSAREGLVGVLARVSLVVVGATATWFILESTAGHRVGVEWQTLDARASELAAHAAMPGSALACLDALAGNVVEGACEKALFATPATTAAAVTHVSAQLNLLADATKFIRRGNPGYEAAIAGLRRTIENDRYGIVAHVLATRDGCTQEKCEALALLKDSSNVSANLAVARFDSYVQRNAAAWPQVKPPPVAQNGTTGATVPALTSLPGATSSYAARPVGPNVFFPSSDSIPPVSIMTSEPPAAEPQTTGSAADASAAAKRPPAPPRRPQPSPKSAQPTQSSARPTPPPMDLNAAARSAPTTSTTQ